MWQLKTADPGAPWMDIGCFTTVAEAARKVSDLESSPASALLFELMIDTKAASDAGVFDYLEHSAIRTGRLYVIKRIRPS